MDLNFFRKLKRRNRDSAGNTEENPTSSGTWSIGIYAGTSPLDLRQAEDASNPVLAAQDVLDVPAEFVADPFMVHVGGTWYMFFEVLNSQKNLGDIGLATSTDGFRWRYEKIVLSERFSLSYPYVFKWDGDYYLIPESNQIKEVRLYRAVDFPSKWALAGTLLGGQRYSDSSVFQYHGRWWMFTATRSRPHNNGRLRLYYADTPAGPWTEHPGSPVVKNNPKIARPGGRVVIAGDEIVRYAQDDYPVYGKQVWAFRITVLTDSHYKEEPHGNCPVIAASGAGWNAGRMHTIDPHQVGPNNWIASVDGFGEFTRDAGFRQPPAEPSGEGTE
jgi:hypothetical protein